MEEINSQTQIKWFPWDYLVVTFGFSWLCWLPMVLETRGLIDLNIPEQAWFLLGIFGPLVGAAYATVRRDSWRGVRRLLTRALDLRIGIRWWLLILTIPLLLPALALLFFWLLGGDPGHVAVLSRPWLVIPTILLMTTLGGGQEEFGWRGYALDILQARWSALTSSLLLGLIWGVWHLPLFFAESAGQYYVPFWAFILASPAMSILSTWVYNSTSKKLFAALLLHGTINAGMDLFPTIQKVIGADHGAFLILCGLYWMWALIVMGMTRGKDLTSRSNQVQAAS